MKRVVTALSTLMWCTMTMAGGVPVAAEQAIRSAIDALGGDLPVSTVAPTPLENLYAVTVGAQVFYVSGDGRYLLQGEVVDLDTRRSLTEARRGAVRLAALDALGEDNMIVYTPRGKVRHEITVFTDIDCPYCQRLHNDLEGYLQRGIRVRYVFLPRAGLDSKSYDKAVWAWCAKDRKTAITRAMQGRTIKRANCDSPVREHFELARSFGVGATPTIVTDDGALLPGYRRPGEMANLLADDEIASR